MQGIGVIEKAIRLSIQVVLWWQDGRQALKIFLSDIAGGAIYTQDVTPKVVLKSVDLCSEHYMTPIDALQLATALSIKFR